MCNNESKPIVLLIDDSIDVHRLLKARLRHESITLECAEGGEQALEMLRTIRPATILLDLDMPGMDGYTVLRQLKSDADNHNIPVIVLSGMQGSDDKVAAFDLGAADYVIKPFDLAELRARLRASLRLHHLVRLLAERADLDGLTGLGNRAHFDKRWSDEVAESHRYGRPLSLIMIDVDFFKKINDTYGHPAGDEVLQGIAHLIQNACRKPDIPCRFGGEEFALILPHTGPQDAQTLAERVRVNISEIVWPRHPETSVTASMGVTGSSGLVKHVSAEQWVEMADRNLYTAKRSGRNRTVASDLSGPAPTSGKAPAKAA